ncbi:MAG: hypothetical protein KDC26_01000 [Armatimonadetes bacterium]|nr:hypothetical protein [Armatimonadota bacterium]
MADEEKEPMDAEGDALDAISKRAKEELDAADADFERRMNDLQGRAAEATKKYQTKQDEVREQRADTGVVSRGAGMGLTAAYGFMGPPIVGYFVGKLIDNSLGKENVWSTWLAMLGVIGGIIFVVFVLQRQNRES